MSTMTEKVSTTAVEGLKQALYSRADYSASLRRFDDAICEALAVG